MGDSERRLGGVERKLDEIRDQLCAQARMTRELLGRGLHSFLIQLNLSSSVHSMTRLSS